MGSNHDDEERVRSVALRTAASILLARQRHEQELVRARETFEEKAADLPHAPAILRATLEATPDAIMVTDRRGRVTDFNLKLAEMWQIPAEVMESREQRALLEFMSRQVRDPERFLVRFAVIEAEAPEETLDLLELADGRVLERFSTLQVVDDRQVGRVWGFRDLTEERRAEEARLRLAAVVDSSDDAIVSKSLEGIIRTWNSGAERIFGYTADEVIGKPITILLPPQRAGEEEQILSRLQRGERVDHFETVRIHKDGRFINVSVTISPIRDSTGRIIGASKIARDITERKRNEQRTQFLADASAALAELTDYESTLTRIAALAVPAFADWCAVDVVDEGGSVRRLALVHSDPAKVRLSRELSRRHPLRPTDRHGAMSVIRTGEAEWVADIDDEVLGEVARDDEHFQRIRSLRLKSYICVPLKLRSGTLGALTFTTAESRRIYGPADLRAAMDLAQRAVISIENAKFVEALRESDRRKDEFLAVLSHELRNPLAPLRNAVQILDAQVSRVPQLQFARDVIDRQVGQLSRLVDDLLDVSRIAQGKVELRTERAELAAVVNDAVEAIRPLVAQRGHQLTVELPPGPVLLEVDSGRITQVLLNLLNNAVKYTNDGGRIWLRAETIAGELLVHVEDNGVGIPAELLPRVFEMFRQGDHSAERAQGGLGIGLTLVQRLVAMHGGFVEAHSEGPGQGSEFIVRLPLAATGHDPATPATAVDEHSAISARRILVIDDNRDAADSLATLLTMSGHEVRSAYDGQTGIDTAQDFRPDVVLLDIGLPKLNGYEVAKRIRAQRGKDVLLVALTGWGQDEDRKRSMAAGFDHHLLKPIDFADLFELLAAKPGTDRNPPRRA
jgi:PAS domain S-box-containing protein